MRNVIKNTFILGLLFIGIVASGQAAVVILKDGSQLHGTIVGATARDVELFTPHGTLHINTDEIVRINYAEDEQPSATPAQNPPASSDEPPPYRRHSHVIRESGDPTNQLFSFNLGFASPLSRINTTSAGGNSGRNGEAGIQLGTQYLYSVTPRVGIGANMEYFNRSATDDFGLIPSADTNVYGDTFLILGVLKYSFTDHGSARPYILGGLGTNHTSTVIDATPLPGFSWSDTDTFETRRLIDDSRWGLASTARLGIDFYFIESTIVAFEIGWTGINNKRYNATPAGHDLDLNDVNGNLSALNVAMRWGWKF